VPDQASVIVHRHASDPEKNLVVFARPSTGGRMDAKFDWSAWNNQFGDVQHGEEFDVSIAVGSRSPPIAKKENVATLTFAKGPAAAPIPGVVSVSDRIAKVAAALSVKPEILHMFRAEERMVAPVVSFAFSLLIVMPIFASLLLIIRNGAGTQGLRSLPGHIQVMAVLFLAGVAAVLVVEFTFWLGMFNLLQVFPTLMALEIFTFLLGIKLSGAMNSVSLSHSSRSKKLN
jgi:hypothetical protein